jgi:hypothetical protein
MIGAVKVLLFVLIVGALMLAPFVALKKPWAVKLWQRTKTLFWVYVLVIAISAIVWLVLRWDEYYG